MMSEPRHSKRFTPNALTEKIVPALLVILVLALLVVLIVVGLSLAGIIPSA
jgi:hypothetical protein